MQNIRYYWMLTALFIQHDQGFHAHLVTLQHNNDVTIARQTNASGATRARVPRACRVRSECGRRRHARPRRAGTTQYSTNSTHVKLKIKQNGTWDDRGDRRHRPPHDYGTK